MRGATQFGMYVWPFVKHESHSQVSYSTPRTPDIPVGLRWDSLSLNQSSTMITTPPSPAGPNSAPNLVTFLPHLAVAGPFSAAFGQFRHMVSRHRSRFDRNRPRIDRVRAEVGRVQARFGRLRGICWPVSARVCLGRIRSRFGRNRPNIGRIRAGVGRFRDKHGRLRTMCCSILAGFGTRISWPISRRTLSKSRSGAKSASTRRIAKPCWSAPFVFEWYWPAPQDGHFMVVRQPGSRHAEDLLHGTLSLLRRCGSERVHEVPRLSQVHRRPWSDLSRRPRSGRRHSVTLQRRWQSGAQESLRFHPSRLRPCGRSGPLTGLARTPTPRFEPNLPHFWSNLARARPIGLHSKKLHGPGPPRPSLRGARPICTWPIYLFPEFGKSNPDFADPGQISANTCATLIDIAPSFNKASASWSRSRTGDQPKVDASFVEPHPDAVLAECGLFWAKFGQVHQVWPTLARFGPTWPRFAKVGRS